MRLLFGLFLCVTAVAGCGPACNSSNICAVTGAAGTDEQVCDGSDFRVCDDSDRGLTISCMTRNQVAVCGPGGWSFQPVGSGGGG
jgi:hypothetical protein